MTSSPVDSSALAADVAAYADALHHELTTDPTYDRWRTEEHTTAEDRLVSHAALVAHLYTGGWNRFGWPEAVGGLGGDVRHRAAFYDQLAHAGLPVPGPNLTLETLAPPLIEFSPELAAEVLGGALAGTEWWGQGFSEPDAGSDLASLRCRARRDGDTYVVSGQKLWMSLGGTAARYVCLVRTGTPESRHRGLSMIMIDRDSPGVTVRPVAIASGLNELAEVFFDDVVVPASRLIGEENGGWAVAMYLLQFERSMYAWQSSCLALQRFVDLRDQVASHTLPDGSTRRLGDTYADIVTLRSRNAQTLRRLAFGDSVGPEASVDKILLARVETGLNDLARDLLGPSFVLSSTADARLWREEWWYSRSAPILGGSAEVQRTIIADHVLGLPKEPS
ncbi:MAG: acyl-CoA dehydrogenase [Aeromicrobium sp.]|nr:acyl-CoA dehydrogenase [Aeromicrobium sp.]